MSADFKNIEKMLVRLKRYLQDDIYDVMGTEAVNHFKDSFKKQGFTDTNLKKWPEVKRRDSGSSWYGFKYGAKRNYSDAATKRPILSGETQELKESIQYRKDTSRRQVTIFSDKIYAKIQNEGGNIRVFGKASAKIPARQFMGTSKTLERHIITEIEKDLTNILR